MPQRIARMQSTATPHAAKEQSLTQDPTPTESSKLEPVRPRPVDAGLGFGARLRRERERRQISIASIAESTKILGALLEGLENEDVSRWPIGFYRRAFIRAYATAIGLEPEPIIREFAERFPEPADVAPAPSAHSETRRGRLRVMLANHCSWFVGGPVLERLPPRLSAAAFDLAVIGAVSVCLFVLLDALWAPLSAAALCYYCGSIIVLGNTPGVCLYAPAQGLTTGPKQERRVENRWWRTMVQRLLGQLGTSALASEAIQHRP
jgi:transcriptional regulator with XRE-family HTH domain